jgi:hypothetical protein
MNNIKRVLCILTAVAFAALALPSVAGNDKKQFSLQMQIVSAPPANTTPPFTVSATVTNVGNSTINSFNLLVSGLTIVGVDQPATGTATFTGSSVTVKNMHPLKSSLTVTIRVNSCGDGMWSAAAWSGSSLNGASFNLDQADSSLATSISCGNLASGAAFTVPDSINPACVTGLRGYYDKDGSIPANPLSFFVTNFTTQLHFRWPDFQAGGDPLATFEYTVCAPGALPETPNTQVAWLNTDGSPASTPGTPAYIDAQDCLVPDVLPAPYGTLAANLLPSDTTIAVNTTMPPPQSPLGTPPGSISYPPGSFPTSPVAPGAPFYIVIGTERIQVQLVCLDNDHDSSDTADCTETAEGEGEALNVLQRGVGGTAVTTHPSGALVMSTPLPLMNGAPAPYGDGITGHYTQALMCVADRFPEGGGHATTFIDIGGDGWGSHP